MSENKTEENKLAGKKIFLIEDDLFFARMLTTKLESKKCIFLYATNGKQAIDDVAKANADIIILDLMLPGGVDGFAVLEKIKADPNTKDIPVLILSNLSEAKDVERGMRLGAFRYLVKATVNLDEIADNIESAINSKIK